MLLEPEVADRASFSTATVLLRSRESNLRIDVPCALGSGDSGEFDGLLVRKRDTMSGQYM